MESNNNHVIVVGRGVLALQVVRIIGSDATTSCILANHVGMRDCGSMSRHVKSYVKIPRPDIDLDGFTDALCELAQGKPNVVLIPVGEETLFLSKVSDKILQACAPQPIRILTSSYATLTALNDNYQFQKCMVRIFLDESCVPRTSLVQTEKDLITSVKACLKAKDLCLIKPISGSREAHIVKREDFERSTNTPQDLFLPYDLLFEAGTNRGPAGLRELSTPLVVQEFVEGKEYSTLSLCLNGAVVAHTCYRSRQVGAHGVSPIRELAPQAQWEKSLDYIRRVAASLKLTGHFGLDMMQRLDGELVALGCSPCVTDGVAFFSPRFSTAVATKIRMAYLEMWEGPKHNNMPFIPPVVPQHIMTFLPTVSCLFKAGSSVERRALFQVASLARDDVWWTRDPFPFVSMVLRFFLSIVYAITLQILPFFLNLYDGEGRTVSEIVREYVVDEVVIYDTPSVESTKPQFETVGGLQDAQRKEWAEEEEGQREIAPLLV